MALLTYAYDPVGTANVIVNAMHVGQQRQAAQQNMLAELAKQIRYERQHALEFERVQAFNAAREASDSAEKTRAFDENKRRYDLENAPYLGDSAPPTTGSPASASELNPAALDLPAPGAAPVVPDTMPSPYKLAGGLSTAGPFDESGAHVIDPLSVPSGETSAPVGPRTLLPPEAVLNGAAPPTAYPLGEAAQAIENSTMPGRGKTHGMLVPRPNVASPIEGDLPTGGGASPDTNPLMADAQTRLAQLGTVLARNKVGTKKANDVMAEAAKNIIAPYRSATASPKVKSAFIDPDNGEIHTMFTNGEWNIPPPDARRLAELKDLNDPRVKLAQEKEKRLSEQSDERIGISQGKLTLAQEKAARDAAAKPAAEKAKALQQERVNLRSLMASQASIKPTGAPKKDGESKEYTHNELDKVRSFDEQITAAKDRIAAMGANPDAPSNEEGDELVTVLSPDGVEGTIPRSKLDGALKAGYTAK